MRQVAGDFNLKPSTRFVLRDTQRTVTDAIPMRGKTTASPTLQNDTITLLSMFFQAKAKCSKIETIITEVVLVGSDLGGNQAGAVTHGVIKERWTATGRGQSVPLNVEFIPDGKGGTFFSIKP